jgi:glycosyltransferase involved in cell wall biosynthesis
LYGPRRTEAYVDSDVYVLPSRYEIFGNTVLEAMACGTPTIVTDCCGLAEFVSKIGIVVSRNPWELRAAIARSLEDEGLRRRFMKESAILVGKEFNFDRIIDRLEKTYRTCLDKG